MDTWRSPISDNPQETVISIVYHQEDQEGVPYNKRVKEADVQQD